MILGLLLGFCPLAHAPSAQGEQNSVLESALDAHFRVARIERELEFFERYALADQPARERARVVLERLRPPGSASGAPSSSKVVAKAIRALDPPVAAADAEAAHARERLEELVDSLDLQPTPGIFAAGTPIEGQVVRVFVSPLYPPPERLPVTLSLVWTRTDGSELLAHRGLVQAAAFDVAGFSVDLPLPGNAAGIWRLLAELERDGLSVRGGSIEVQCVAGLAESKRKAFEGLADRADPRQPLATWIALDMQRGLRTLARVRADDQLARLEGHGRAACPYPWSPAFNSSSGDVEWIWRLDPPGEQRATLVLLCPSTEPAEASLSRSSWSGLQGWRVLSTRLPRGAPGEGTSKEVFARVSAALTAKGEDGPIVCVARGDTIGKLAMDFYAANSRPYAAEILWMSATPASAESLAGVVPRWVFAPGGRAAQADSEIGPKTWWLDASPIPLIADFELPQQLKTTLPFVLEKLLGASKASK